MKVLPLNVSPDDCDPTHDISHPEKIIELANKFVEGGWNPLEPALIAYPIEKRLQLLSGTHRWFAAKMAELKTIPVVVVPFDAIQELWGTDAWVSEVMTAGNRGRI